ncbi:MAG: flavin reductase family protein [Bacteroidales bacterium]|nr:flavin reductase family protein [Bacteroidales bacterium]
MVSLPQEYLHIDPNEISVPKFHHLMLGAIAPRPIAFASTIDLQGNPNLSPFSFFNAFGANPPIVVFSPSRRGLDNTTKHTYENIKEVPEVVINAVTFDMVQKVSDSSADFPKGVNEFNMVGFTMQPSDLIKPFRVKESPVQFECKVLQVIETGDGPAAGNLVICEILRIHVNPAVMDDNGRIDPHKIDLVGRLGGEYYVRASGSALFEIAKPG